MLRKLRIITCLAVFALCEVAGYLAGARPAVVMTRGLIAIGAVWLSFRLAALLIEWVTLAGSVAPGEPDSGAEKGA